MEVTVVVLFQRALAHYTVAVREEGTYWASLLKYKGNKQHEPPHRIWFKKQGRHCIGDIDNQELMDDLFHAVQSKLANESSLLTPYMKPASIYMNRYQ